VALALVAALLSPAAHPPPPPRLELVLTLPHRGDGPVAIGGGSVYSVATTAAGMALVAHRLADGTQRWTVPVPASGQTPWVRVSGDVPIVTGLDPTRPGQFDLRMGAFDPDTGRLLWTRTGSPRGPGRGGDRWLLVQRQLSIGEGSPGPAAVEFTAVDIRTGEALWTFRTGERAAIAEAATGEPVMDVHGWVPMQPSNGPGVVLQRVLREPGPDRTGGRLSIGRLRTGAAGVQTLGTIDAAWCQFHAERLVCDTGGAAWRIWRIR
jgi:outer membrane protein assembly factor BamB